MEEVLTGVKSLSVYYRKTSMTMPVIVLLVVRRLLWLRKNSRQTTPMLFAILLSFSLSAHNSQYTADNNKPRYSNVNRQMKQNVHQPACIYLIR